MSDRYTIQRFTTTFIEVEDRLRLMCETDNGRLVIWLTARLTHRLIPILLQWLERQRMNKDRQVLLPLPLQRTTAPVDSAEASYRSWLTHAIDIRTTVDQAHLIFRSCDNLQAVLALSAAQVRSWMEILYDAYVTAQWPLEVWPAWVNEYASVYRNDQPAIWH